MTKIYYAVIATLPSQSIADEYVAWLEDGHVDQVIKGGAHTGMIIRLEPTTSDQSPKPTHRVMTQYIFSTREVFDHYVEHHSPALRAEGLKRFGPQRGVKMERVVGEVV